MYIVVYALSEKQQAWEDAENAHARGEITAKRKCSCGSTKNLVMHHGDHAKTRRVSWKCKACNKTLSLKEG